MGNVQCSVKKKKGGEEGKVWVDSRSKRYIPAVNDSVLGIITSRFTGGFRVDIGSSTSSTLDALAFEGATKRNTPRFEIGTLVYARVTLADRDMEPEIVCVDERTGKAEGFGEVKGGLLVDGVDGGLCRILLTPQSPLSTTLPFPFELTIGSNNRIVISADSVERVVLVKRLLEALGDGTVGKKGMGVEEWFERTSRG